MLYGPEAALPVCPLRTITSYLFSKYFFGLNDDTETDSAVSNYFWQPGLFINAAITIWWPNPEL